MVPSNALQRTFRVAYGDATATGFTVDVDQRQYLVTARHVVPDATDSTRIRVQHNRQWVEHECRVVGVAPENIDILVLAPSSQLSPTHNFEPTTEGLYLSQDVFFLGFPYGLQADIGELNNDYPLPLVKKACVSMLNLRAGETNFLLLDGHNNPGFSGGPVVYAPQGQLGATRVAGVISSYRAQWESVYHHEAETELRYKYNTGIVVAYSIKYAVELIRANPIGAAIS